MNLIRLFSLLLLAAAPAFAADWPCWRGPNGDDKSPETGLLKSWPAAGPAVLWEAPLGQGYSSVAVAGGRVYTMFQDETRQYVVAIDEQTGKELWRTPTGPLFTCKTNHNGPRSTPSVDGERVYALDGNGVLVCLNAADGKPVWQQNILELAGAKNITWGIAQSPYIAGDLVLVNPGGSNGAALMALHKQTGDVVWKSGNGLAGYSTPVPFTQGGVDQFLFFMGDSLTGVAARDGKVLWSFPWITRNDVNAAAPMVLDDMIFISSGYNKGAAVVKVDLANAAAPVSQVWHSNVMECHFGSPIRIGECLYGYNQVKLTCIDFKTGARKWEDSARALPPKGEMTWAEGLFYLYGENGTLALAKLDPTGFEKISEVKILPGAQRWATPVIANGRLYVRDDKKLLALDIKAK